MQQSKDMQKRCVHAAMLGSLHAGYLCSAKGIDPRQHAFNDFPVYEQYEFWLSSHSSTPVAAPAAFAVLILQPQAYSIPCSAEGCDEPRPRDSRMGVHAMPTWHCKRCREACKTYTCPTCNKVKAAATVVLQALPARRLQAMRDL